MGFQILDKTGEPISIQQLDKQVAEFWGVEIDKKWYACPKGKNDEQNKRFMGRNWFDTICYLIHLEKIEDFDMLLMAFLRPYINMDFGGWNELPYIEKLQYLFNSDYEKPYIELILHWKSLGYKPKYATD